MQSFPQKPFIGRGHLERLAREVQNGPKRAATAKYSSNRTVLEEKAGTRNGEM